MSPIPRPHTSPSLAVESRRPLLVHISQLAEVKRVASVWVTDVFMSKFTGQVMYLRQRLLINHGRARHLVRIQRDQFVMKDFYLEPRPVNGSGFSAFSLEEGLGLGFGV